MKRYPRPCGLPALRNSAMRNPARQTLLLVAFVAAFAGVRAPAAQPAPAAEPNPKANQEPAARPTAEDILRELRKRQPGNEVIPPASWEGGVAPAQAPKLLPEGTAVVGAVGRVGRDGEWWSFVFDKAAVKKRYGFEPQTDSIKLLPNSTLEGLVRMARAGEEHQPFELTGEVTVFRGENYLLARSALRGEKLEQNGGGGADASHRESGGGALPHEQDRQSKTADGPPPGSKEPEGPPAAERVADDSISERKPSGVAADASAEDVLEMMRQVNPSRELSPAQKRASGMPEEDVSSVSAPIFEGTPVIRRTGRVIPQGDWWTFTFDGDATEQPLRVLPNQGLQFMVDLYERSPAGLVFTISGEVTEFSGRNYLLIRAVARRLDLGNLRR